MPRTINQSRRRRRPARSSEAVFESPHGKRRHEEVTKETEAVVTENFVKRSKKPYEEQPKVALYPFNFDFSNENEQDRSSNDVCMLDEEIEPPISFMHKLARHVRLTSIPELISLTDMEAIVEEVVGLKVVSTQSCLAAAAMFTSLNFRDIPGERNVYEFTLQFLNAFCQAWESKHGIKLLNNKGDSQLDISMQLQTWASQVLQHYRVALPDADKNDYKAENESRIENEQTNTGAEDEELKTQKQQAASEYVHEKAEPEKDKAGAASDAEIYEALTEAEDDADDTEKQQAASEAEEEAAKIENQHAATVPNDEDVKTMNQHASTEHENQETEPENHQIEAESQTAKTEIENHEAEAEDEKVRAVIESVSEVAKESEGKEAQTVIEDKDKYYKIRNKKASTEAENQEVEADSQHSLTEAENEDSETKVDEAAVVNAAEKEESITENQQAESEADNKQHKTGKQRSASESENQEGKTEVKYYTEHQHITTEAWDEEAQNVSEHADLSKPEKPFLSEVPPTPKERAKYKTQTLKQPSSSADPPFHVEIPTSVKLLPPQKPSSSEQPEFQPTPIRTTTHTKETPSKAPPTEQSTSSKKPSSSTGSPTRHKPTPCEKPPSHVEAPEKPTPSKKSTNNLEPLHPVTILMPSVEPPPSEKPTPFKKTPSHVELPEELTPSKKSTNTLEPLHPVTLLTPSVELPPPEKPTHKSSITKISTSSRKRKDTPQSSSNLILSRRGRRRRTIDRSVNQGPILLAFGIDSEFSECALTQDPPGEVSLLKFDENAKERNFRLSPSQDLGKPSKETIHNATTGSLKRLLNKDNLTQGPTGKVDRNLSASVHTISKNVLLHNFEQKKSQGSTSKSKKLVGHAMDLADRRFSQEDQNLLNQPRGKTFGSMEANKKPKSAKEIHSVLEKGSLEKANKKYRKDFDVYNHCSSTMPEITSMIAEIHRNTLDDSEGNCDSSVDGVSIGSARADDSQNQNSSAFTEVTSMMAEIYRTSLQHDDSE